MLIANIASALLLFSGFSAAVPSPILPQSNDNILEIRASKDVNPAAVTGTTCTDKNAPLGRMHSGSESNMPEWQF
ncbi:hypothetical protein CSPX01_13017 [Colletotrichum filicis]|nr:hypothetical protein CSPX01_13017 [Colletotrichum filicis]